MKILISQMKPYLGDVEKNLEKILRDGEEGIKENCDIAVFPELSLTGTLLEDGVFETALSEIPEKLLELSRKITLIFGGVLKENKKFYNCGYCLEDGKILAVHKKVFLSNCFGGSESRYFSRGKEIKSFKSRHGVFGITLGEEGLNPMVNGILSQDGAEIIFNLVNESLPAEDEISVYETAAKANSVYNKNFTVTVNRVGTEDGVVFTGSSFAVSPYGKIIEKTEKFAEKLSIINIDLKDTERAGYNSCWDNENNLEVIKKEIERIME